MIGWIETTARTLPFRKGPTSGSARSTTWSENRTTRSGREQCRGSWLSFNFLRPAPSLEHVRGSQLRGPTLIQAIFIIWMFRSALGGASTRREVSAPPGAQLQTLADRRRSEAASSAACRGSGVTGQTTTCTTWGSRVRRQLVQLASGARGRHNTHNLRPARGHHAARVLRQSGLHGGSLPARTRPVCDARYRRGPSRSSGRLGCARRWHARDAHSGWFWQLFDDALARRGPHAIALLAF